MPKVNETDVIAANDAMIKAALEKAADIARSAAAALGELATSTDAVLEPFAGQRAGSTDLDIIRALRSQMQMHQTMTDQQLANLAQRLAAFEPRPDPVAMPMPMPPLPLPVPPMPLA